MRRIDIDLAETTPKKSHRHQRGPDQQRGCINIGKIQDLARKEQSLAQGVNPRPEHNPETENDKLNSPPHRPDSRSEGLLQIHKNQHSGQQQRAIQYFGRRMRANPPGFARQVPRKTRRQLLPEKQGHAYRDQKCRQDEKS